MTSDGKIDPSPPGGNDMNPTAMEPEAQAFIYTNYRGETATRRALFERIWFGVTTLHPEPQWFARGFDLDKQEYRDFALKDITWDEDPAVTQARVAERTKQIRLERGEVNCPSCKMRLRLVGELD